MWFSAFILEVLKIYFSKHEMSVIQFIWLYLLHLRTNRIIAFRKTSMLFDVLDILLVYQNRNLLSRLIILIRLF